MVLRKRFEVLYNNLYYETPLEKSRNLCGDVAYKLSKVDNNGVLHWGKGEEFTKIQPPKNETDLASDSNGVTFNVYAPEKNMKGVSKVTITTYLVNNTVNKYASLNLYPNKTVIIYVLIDDCYLDWY